ncbi:hypothetical protein F4781DRAFT_416513 [Annulohypoxylon bovei var. microspora]|nr:hypothetical protein F4781DRAFT_416513 [Annulohypoxylon bovei var. microspora]
MYISQAMLSLPPTLLVLLAAATQAHAQHHPTAIRKMSLDEGEKIFPEYYAFGPASAPAFLPHDEEALLPSGNSSAAVPFLPPYPRHLDHHHYRSPSPPRNKKAADGKLEEEDTDDRGAGLYRRTREAPSRLRGRQFACPSDTHSCTNIAQPNYCCASGTTCFVVTNAPESGNVGCCPVGQNCGVTVGACTSGSTACPANVGGGCCIAGFVCAEVGCVASAVSVITQSTLSSTIASSISMSPTTQVVTTTATATVTNSATITQSGGVPPYRPTSGSSALTSASSSTSYCPTGFYACVARAGGGCCRTGRDCSTTSCPAPAPSTTIVSNGATVVVPLSDAQAAASASVTPTCAAGWFLCGTAAGPTAGCCPDGYGCGTESCTLSASSVTATVQKELPSSAAGCGFACKSGLAVWVSVWFVAGVFALGLA